jgi:hypothetical protein
VKNVVDALIVLAVVLLYVAVGVAGAWAVWRWTGLLACLLVWIVGWAVAGLASWWALIQEPPVGTP